MTESRFFKGLRAAGYERGHRENAGLISSSSKNVGPWSITLDHTSVSPDVMDNAQPEHEVNTVRVERDGQQLPLEQLPPTLYSEILRDLHTIAGVYV